MSPRLPTRLVALLLAHAGATSALATEPPGAPWPAPPTSPIAAASPLQFLAVASLGPSTNLFALGDTGPDGKTHSLGWKQIADTVAGVRLLRYDDNADALFVQDASGATLKLVLKSAQTAKSTLPPFTREQAKAYLAARVALISAKSLEKYPDQAVLDFDADQKASPSLQADLAQGRQFAKEHNLIALVARKEDGTYTASTSPRYPRDDVPEHIRANLTEDDWLEYEIASETASFRANQTRKKNQK